MLEFKNISYSISKRKLFENTSLEIPDNYHLGLVGSNGIGKSTLFNLITKNLSLEEGKITLKSNRTIGILEQEIQKVELSLLDFVLSSRITEQNLLKELESSENPDRISFILNKLDEINAYDSDWKASTILSGLGFNKTDQSKPLSDFSGGWRMRVGLAAALFNEPDLLLLDEPTNHLDFETNSWLENFLVNYKNSFILISHDRETLNKTVSHIIHIDQLKLNLYTGNYDQFEKQYAQKKISQQLLFQKQEAYKKNVLKFVNRFGSKASKAKQAQSRLKSLEKMDFVDAVITDRSIKFSFPKPKNLGTSMIVLNEVDVGYEKNNPVLQGINLSISNDSRIALLGANGNGKSTLIKLISGIIKPMKGTISKNKNIKIGYFAQHLSEELELDLTPFEVLSEKLKNEEDLKIRGVLGKFGFDKTKSETKIHKLSGGEKTRLILCLISYDSPNILLLDEPTNHLDIDSRTSLINALNDFEGCVILVSHDSKLVENVADHLIIVKNGKVNNFSGDLDEYRSSLSNDKKNTESSKNKNNTDRKKIRNLENKIKKLTDEKKELEKKLSSTENISDYEKLNSLSEEYENLNNQIDSLEQSWLLEAE